MIENEVIRRKRKRQERIGLSNWLNPIINAIFVSRRDIGVLIVLANPKRAMSLLILL